MATGVRLTDGTYLPRHLQNDDCIKASECVCGFCKGLQVTSATVIRQCDYGSCTNRATRTCARHGYPICDDCARIAARTHPTAYASSQTLAA